VFSVVIPLTGKHRKYLFDLLIDLRNSTNLIDEVIVARDPFFFLFNIFYILYLRIRAKISRIDFYIYLTTSNRRSFSGMARNRGWELATSEWVVFLDADDTYATNMFEIIKEVIEIKPDANLILHSYKYNEDVVRLKNFRSESEFRSDVIGSKDIMDYTLRLNQVQNRAGLKDSNIEIPPNKTGVTVVHHGHATVRNEIYNMIKYKNVEKAEDGIFCQDVLFGLGGVYFIPLELSIYNVKLSSWRDITLTRTLSRKFNFKDFRDSFFRIFHFRNIDRF